MLLFVDDLRKDPRFEVTAYVDYSGRDVLLMHRIENLSLSGMCLRSTTVEDLGTRVDLVLNFADLKTQVALQGEVVWVNREEPMDMGIRFINVSEASKDVLRQYLQKLRSKRGATR